MPKVSVVIPVYNVEGYLRQCLDSIVNQTLKDIEIICVDDASPDGSGRILEEYSANDRRLVLERHRSNLGLSRSRNTGLSCATGEYVYFMDGDDYLDLDALDLCYECAEENSLDALSFDAEVFVDDSEGDVRAGEAEAGYYERDTLLEGGRVLSGKEFFRYAFLRDAYRASACLSLIRLDTLRRNKLAFYPGILHEDELFAVQMYFASERVSYYPRKFFKRRLRRGSIRTKEFGPRNVEDILLVARKLQEIYACEQCRDVRQVLLGNIYLLLRWIEQMMLEIADPVRLQECKDLLKNAQIWRRYMLHKRAQRGKTVIKMFLSHFLPGNRSGSNLRETINVGDRIAG